MSNPAYDVPTIDRLIAVNNHGDDGEECNRLYRQIMGEIRRQIAEYGHPGAKIKASLSQGRRIIVPDAFLLNIPVFEGETSQLLPVRLQYRKAGGIKWFMSLVEYPRAVRFAVHTEADRVRAATGLPLFYGQPAS